MQNPSLKPFSIEISPTQHVILDLEKEEDKHSNSCESYLNMCKQIVTLICVNTSALKIMQYLFI